MHIFNNTNTNAFHTYFLKKCYHHNMITIDKKEKDND